MSTFTEWESFYVIVGSSAAALTGLQFVVIALIADSQRRVAARSTRSARRRSSISASRCSIVGDAERAVAPLGVPAIVCRLRGFIGLAYSMSIVRRRAEQTSYSPSSRTGSFTPRFPSVAYGLLALASLTLGHAPHGSLFAIAAAVLLLLFIGIHNAWDTATYLVTRDDEKPDDTKKPPADGATPPSQAEFTEDRR